MSAPETPATGPLLRIEGLTVSYGQAASPANAVQDVALTVVDGEFVSLVGQSGSGKSTLVGSVLGLLPRHSRIVSGSIDLAGSDIVGLRDRQIARLRGAVVGYVPQDPGTSLNPVKPVGVQVEDAIRVHRRIGRDAARLLAEERLAAAGLPRPREIASRYPHELSGGMKQRVLIAIALANEPRLLLADEPTSALDVTVQKRILDHLEHLRTELGLGILLVTHDLGVAAERADRILVMHEGRIVESGTADAVVGDPAHAYTRRLISAAPHLTQRRLRPRDQGPAETVESGPALRLQNISKRFARRGADVVRAVVDASITVRAGTTHAIVGESGAGKSTVARIAVGLETPTEGAVWLGEKRLDTADRRALRQLRRDLQFVHQNPYASLDPKYTVAQVIAEPLVANRVGGGSAEREARVRELLDAVQLGQDLDARLAGQLSGGQRQRVAIARSLALEPRVVILDEAVSALDVVVQSSILQLLVDLQSRLGVSYLFITHDLGVVRLIADDVTVMRAGEVVETGTVDQVLGAPRSAYTRDLLAAAPLAGAARSSA